MAEEQDHGEVTTPMTPELALSDMIPGYLEEIVRLQAENEGLNTQVKHLLDNLLRLERKCAWERERWARAADECNKAVARHQALKEKVAKLVVPELELRSTTLAMQAASIAELINELKEDNDQ